MNKSELIEVVAKDVGSTKTETKKYLDAILNTITNTVAEGDEVKLPTFGSFKSRQRKAREVRNPRSGDKMTLAQRVVATFKPGTIFKARVASAQAQQN